MRFLRGKSKIEKVPSREIKIKALIFIKIAIEINLKKVPDLYEIKKWSARKS